MKSNNYRLFFAVELEASVKVQLLDFQHSLLDLTARPIAGENFHITLSFLGNTSEKNVESVLDAISPLKIAPFEVKTDSLICWPKSKIIALSISDPDKKLAQCKKEIEKQLSDASFFQFDKREFIPHVSLFRQFEEPVIQPQDFSTTIAVEAVSLMRSQQLPQGVFYETLEQWPLKYPSIKQQLLGK